MTKMLYPQGKVYIGVDEENYKRKDKIKKHLLKSGWFVVDLGVFDVIQNVDAVTLAREVAEKVLENENACNDTDDHDSDIHGCETRGVMIATTGVAILTSVNSLQGMNASLCYDVEMAQNARERGVHLICLGTNDLKKKDIVPIINTFLNIENAN